MFFNLSCYFEYYKVSLRNYRTRNIKSIFRIIEIITHWNAQKIHNQFLAIKTFFGYSSEVMRQSNKKRMREKSIANTRNINTTRSKFIALWAIMF